MYQADLQMAICKSFFSPVKYLCKILTGVFCFWHELGFNYLRTQIDINIAIHCMKEKIFAFLFLFLLTGSIASQRKINIEGQVYNLGILSKNIEMDILTKEMLSIHAKISYTFNINDSEVTNLHNNLGPNYITLFCEPVLNDAIRQVFGKYQIIEILNDKRALINSELHQIINAQFIKYHIHFRDIYIKNIELPEYLKAAIEEKLIAEQENQRHIYLQEIEAKKLEISRLKAKSIMEYNLMIDSSLTEKILQLKYIEALEKMALSNNAKVIIVGDEKVVVPKMLKEEN